MNLNFKQRPGALRKDTSLVNAARERDVQHLMRLCQGGVDTDYQDSGRSSTSLMTAANWGKDDCVKLLLRMGAKINMQDKVRHVKLSICSNKTPSNYALFRTDAHRSYSLSRTASHRWLSQRKTGTMRPCERCWIAKTIDLVWIQLIRTVARRCSTPRKMVIWKLLGNCVAEEPMSRSRTR